MINILESDSLFSDSPQAGDAKCKCSRCSRVIKEDEIPMRITPVYADGDILDFEYRYCEKCQNEMGIFHIRYFDEQDEIPDLNNII